jgi:hypothetical protein
MQPEENLDLANGLHLRVLVRDVRDDASLLVEATSEEQDPALWGPRPAGPYSLRDAQPTRSSCGAVWAIDASPRFGRTGNMECLHQMPQLSQRP